MTQAYPLTWPENFPRTRTREAGRFKTTLPAALENVQDSLRRFASDSGKRIDNLIMSSNVTLGAHRPADPGVAVWFVWDGIQICIPVDRYTTVEANLQAIHHIIEARRIELRHGTLALIRATFTGFAALPSPSGRPWREVLGLNGSATVDDVRRAYRVLAADRHPDHGGSNAAMAELNRARDAAIKEIGDA